MNYSTFLMMVDQLTAVNEADSLRLFIHEIARTLPEHNRERFLATLKRFCGGSPDIPVEEKKADEWLSVKVDSILEALKGIQAGDRELECEYNEEWDEWQDEEEDSIRFSDPDHLLADITVASKMVHQCLDREEYTKGIELAKALSELTVQVSGDCIEKEMRIQDLVNYDLLDIDLKKMIKEALYLTCMGAGETERAESMLTIIDKFDEYSISLNDILQTGSTEIDLKSLLPSWIEALSKRPAAKADKLLVEAQNMLQDQKDALEYASRYAESHPVLYQNILSTGINHAGPDEMMHIGFRAMNEVPVEHPTRSEISLLTAEYALAEHNSRNVEECWMEAFRSSPTVVNFLRLRLQSPHWQDYANETRNIYTAYYRSEGLWLKRPLPALLFFDEQFEKMIREYMQVESGIGWSSTFMKEGIALLLLAMDSGTTIHQGISRMQEIAIRASSFDSDTYCRGTDLKRNTSTADLFRDCFQRWKNQVTLPDHVCESWLKQIDQWVSLRVAAIMDANRRNYYDECAAFVAAYGEVLESRGQPGKKNQIMQQYKAEYSRRRAFHDELRKLGMKK